jgi:multicomponent Na+:H+ antiporter subunit D
VPWHFWLPDAHATAPGPVSAMFSGALINVGIYALARNLYTLAPALRATPLPAALMVVALASILVGGIQMLQQESPKRILAFSSVSQMGYVLLGIAIGSPAGLLAAAFHLVHHALVKSVLFMAAGLLSLRLNIHTLAEGGGLARRVPVTTAIFCLAGLSLSGMPLFSGFISKTLLEEAAVEAGWGFAAAAATVGGALTIAGMARLTWRIFLAPAPEGVPARQRREFSVVALLPMVALVGASLAAGVAAGWPAEHLAWPAARALLGGQQYVAAVLGGGGATPVAAHLEATPSPFDWHHWWGPLLTLVGGGLLTFLMVARPHLARRPWAWPFVAAARQLRQWHSGVVTDYALWTAAGTALLLVVVLAAVLAL